MITPHLVLPENLKSNSQKIRIASENWVSDNLFCINCGELKLNNFENNRPVADFYCQICDCQFELKSKLGSFSKKIVDGSYNSMIKRISSLENPNFIFMNYNNEYKIENLFVVPKYYFIPSIIEKRNPLSETARRSGWIGCNILFNQIPEIGKIKIIENRNIFDKVEIIKNWKKAHFIAQDTTDVMSRAWIIEIVKCIEINNSTYFMLRDIYKYEASLKIKFPKNNNIRAKIRQQIQVLRDLKYLSFEGNGKYKLI